MSPRLTFTALFGIVVLSFALGIYVEEIPLPLWIAHTAALVGSALFAPAMALGSEQEIKQFHRDQKRAKCFLRKLLAEADTLHNKVELRTLARRIRDIADYHQICLEEIGTSKRALRTLSRA